MNDSKSPLTSKVNGTQIVMFIAMFAALFGFDMDPELQKQLAIAITATSGVVTIIWRTYFTTKKLTR